MIQDRITQLRISGLRVINHIELDLSGLTVLIGGAGTGKTSILDALDILGHAGKKTPSIDGVMRIHGRAQSLLRQGNNRIVLGITIEGNGPKIDYEFDVICQGDSVVVNHESIQIHEDQRPIHLITRDSGSWYGFGVSGEKIFVPPNALALPRIREISPEAKRLAEALDRIDCGHERGWPFTIREKRHPDEETLTLPRAFRQLHEQGKATWERVLETARLGLSADLKDLVLKPSGTMNIELEAIFESLPAKSLPVSALSDGQQSYLAFVALYELSKNSTEQGFSIISFDDLEANLHPALRSRVVWMLEEMAKETPVLVTTHSDALLDALTNPLTSVVLCDLDENQTTCIRRPDPAHFASWSEDYQGMGSIRAAGYQAHVFGKDDVIRRPAKKA